MNRLLIFVLLQLVLASCAVGPDYKRPESATQTSFKEAGNWKIAVPNDSANRGKWWEAFADRSEERRVGKEC